MAASTLGTVAAAGIDFKNVSTFHPIFLFRG
jgi:hypothetical protein